MGVHFTWHLSNDALSLHFPFCPVPQEHIEFVLREECAEMEIDRRPYIYGTLQVHRVGEKIIQL